MEAVHLDLVAEPRRQGVRASRRGQGGVEAGVEAGYLGRAGPSSSAAVDGIQGRRLV